MHAGPTTAGPCPVDATIGIWSYTRRMVQLPSSLQVLSVACHTFSQFFSHCLPSPKPRCATMSAILQAAQGMWSIRRYAEGESGCAACAAAAALPHPAGSVVLRSTAGRHAFRRLRQRSLFCIGAHEFDQGLVIFRFDAPGSSLQHRAARSGFRNSAWQQVIAGDGTERVQKFGLAAGDCRGIV